MSTEWVDTGKKSSEATYKNDNLVTETKYIYYPNGKIKSEKTLKDRKRVGKYSLW